MAKASATIGVNGAGFERGLDNMRKQAGKFGSDIKSTIAGAFAFGAVASFFSKFASEMDRVGKLATRLGETTEAIQQIGGAAELAGADLEMVVKSLTRIEIAARKGGETFKATGIAQDEFIGATSQNKLVMLAEAYQAAVGDQDKMLAMMELLGSKGQDLIPLLKQGPDALRESMAGIPVVSDQVIRATEALNDKVSAFGKDAVARFGAFIGVMQQAGVMAQKVGPIIMKALVFPPSIFFNWGKLKEKVDEGWMAIADLDKTAEEFAKNQKERAAAAQGIIDAEAIEEATEALKEAARLQEQIAKAQEGIEKTLRDRALERMSIEDRIAELKKEQDEAAQRMETAGIPELERVEAMKKVLDLEKQIESEQDKQRKAAESAAKEAEAQQEEILNAKARLFAEEDRQMLAALDPAERAKILEARQTALMQESDLAKSQGDELTAAEKKLEALQMQDSINRALEEAAPKQEGAEASSSSRSIVASSLASVGGGGGSYVSGFDPQVRELREQTALLRQLVNVATTEQQAPSKASEAF
jgi:hypothetical protein